MRCRACSAAVEPVVDLGEQPAGGVFPRPDDPPDQRLPLRLGMCEACGLAQLTDPTLREVDGPDATSPLASTTMASHAHGFVDDLITRGLASPRTRIVSVASHGGHLAPLFRERGLSAIIMEGDQAWAERRAADGEQVISGRIDEPGPDSIAGVGSFDTVVDNYLLAHLERPRAALGRMAALLAPGGTLVLEFDHLLSVVEGGQWDAIRHGHNTYMSLTWLSRELEAAGLTVFDAVVQPVYGGALRIFARAGGRPMSRVDAVLAREASAGLGRPASLVPLAEAVQRAGREVVPYLGTARVAGRRVVGYGAPARAITFLNALGIGPELLPFVADRSLAKQGRTIPGVRTPIVSPGRLAAEPPDEVLILTWNLVAEVRAALAPLVAAGTRLVVAIPGLTDVTVEVARPVS